MRNYCCLHGFGMTSKRYCSVKRAKGKSILHEPVLCWRIRARDFWKDFGAGGWGSWGRGWNRKTEECRGQAIGQRWGSGSFHWYIFFFPNVLVLLLRTCLFLVGWLVGG